MGCARESVSFDTVEARRADHPEPRGVSEAMIVYRRAGCVWIESILFGLAKD
jgi:hypothetical protein